ncbi:MAG: DUF1634 domain-containing protein [Deltaproteobacteria bacterium]|jgi:uncharacterized membrane protein|nr:DUF1634 domain-containing protein [Deltaproteobacteria bacterium]
MAASTDIHPQVAEDEDRILRLWTPILLRAILVVAAVILIVGLILMTTKPDFYVARFHAAQAQQFVAKTSFAERVVLAVHGDPHSVMTVGLYVLTLVPLARVAFSFLLFVKERDYAYVGFTAYVLTGLIVGMLLGRMG